MKAYRMHDDSEIEMVSGFDGGDYELYSLPSDPSTTIQFQESDEGNLVVSLAKLVNGELIFHQVWVDANGNLKHNTIN